MWKFSKSSNVLFEWAIVKRENQIILKAIKYPCKTCMHTPTHAYMCAHIQTHSLCIMRTNPHEKMWKEHPLLKLVSRIWIKFQCNQSKTVKRFDTDWPTTTTTNFTVISNSVCVGGINIIPTVSCTHQLLLIRLQFLQFDESFVVALFHQLVRFFL